MIDYVFWNGIMTGIMIDIVFYIAFFYLGWMAAIEWNRRLGDDKFDGSHNCC
jgi:hypothetical protein